MNRPFTSLSSLARLLLGGLLLMTACRQSATDPQPAATPSLTLTRTLTDSKTNRTVTAAYTLDSLRYTVTKNRKGLSILLEPKKPRTGNDIVLVQLDSTVVRPGLVGTYAVPLVDTLATTLPPSPFWVDYTYYQEVRPLGASAKSIGSQRYLPVSSFSITGYDTARHTITGRFTFRFEVWDPFAPVGTGSFFTSGWTVTLTSTFANLPIRQL